MVYWFAFSETFLSSLFDIVGTLVVFNGSGVTGQVSTQLEIATLQAGKFANKLVTIYDT